VLLGSSLAGKLLEKQGNVSKLSLIVYNLSITVSNLNGLGLWIILLPPRTNETVPPRGSPVGLKNSLD
jgi:hypothetical protein